MSQTIAIQSRLDFLGLDDAQAGLIRAQASYVAKVLPEILGDYYARLERIRGREELGRRGKIELMPQQQAYFTDLFKARFDESYSERLQPMALKEIAMGFGSRIHVFTLASIVLRLIRDAGARSRFSGKDVAETSSALVRLLVLEAISAMEIEERELRRTQDERKSMIDGELKAFLDVSGNVLGALGGAASTLDTVANLVQENSRDATREIGAASDGIRSTRENVSLSAAAAEELAAAIAEITRDVSTGLDRTEAAAAQIGRMREGLDELAEIAGRIGSIVSTIADISGKTNLLALNATIEAARAGSAGKGFAVVASEVKTLAGQTNQATSNIADQVGAVQASTNDSVALVVSVVQAMTDLSSISASIAGAVQQQQAATNEIARSASGASADASQIETSMASIQTILEKLNNAAQDLIGQSRIMSQQSDAFSKALGTLTERLRAFT